MENIVKTIYQVTIGKFPSYTILYVAPTREAASEWIRINKKGSRVVPVHLVWLHGGWRRVNSYPVSTDVNAYKDYPDAHLKQDVIRGGPPQQELFSNQE